MTIRHAVVALCLLATVGCKDKNHEDEPDAGGGAGGGGGGTGDNALTAAEQATLDQGLEATNAVHLVGALASTLFGPIDPTQTALQNSASMERHALQKLGLAGGDAGSGGCGTISRTSTLISVQFTAGPGCTLPNGLKVEGPAELRITRGNSALTVVLWANRLVVNGNAIAGRFSFETADGSAFKVNGDIYSQGIRFTSKLTMAFGASGVTTAGEVTINRSNVPYSMELQAVASKRGDCYPSGGTLITTTSMIRSTITYGTATASTGQVGSETNKKTGTATLPGYGVCGSGGVPQPAVLITIETIVDVILPVRNPSYTDDNVRFVISVNGPRDRAQAFIDGELEVTFGGPPYVLTRSFAAGGEGEYEVFARATAGANTFDSRPFTVIVDNTPPVLTWHGPPLDAGITPSWHEAIELVFSEPLDTSRYDAGSITLTVGGAPMRLERAVISQDLETIWLKPADDLFTSPASIQVRLGPTLRDRAGNEMASVSFDYVVDRWSRTTMGLSPEGNSARGQAVTVSEYGPTSYLAWYERKHGPSGAPDPASSKVQVRKVTSGSSTLLPALPFNEPSTSTAVQIAGSEPVVAFVSTEGAGPSVTVARFENDAWTVLGGPQPSLDAPALVVDLANNPVVAANEVINGVSALQVSRFGTRWIPLLTMPTDGGLPGSAGAPALAVHPKDPRLAVAWVEVVGGTSRVHVSMSTPSGMTWRQLFDLNLKPTGKASAPSLIWSDAYLYAAWQEDDGFGPDVHAARVYNNTTDVVPWELLGGALDVERSAEAMSPTIRIDDRDFPVVAWLERGLQGKESIRLARFNGLPLWTLIDIEPAASAVSPNHLGRPAMTLHTPVRLDGTLNRSVPTISWSLEARSGAVTVGEVGLSRLNYEGDPLPRVLPWGGPPGACQPLSNGQPKPTLSATGCFTSLGVSPPTATDLLPYEVISTHWSDGALNRHWLQLPAGAKVGYATAGSFTWPVNAALVEELAFEQTPGAPTSRRPVETRFLVNAGDAGWQRFSYQWNDAFTEATLVPGATSARKFFGFTDGGADAGHWQVYPSRRECLRCHNPTAGTVLGPQAAQLQRNVDYGALATNQFGVWLQGVFEPAEFPPVNPLSSPGDVSEPLGKRARSSLAANCAHCHQPGAEGSTRDYRWETPTRDGGLCDDVLPGDAGYSRLHLRMAARDGGQMPPIATERVDTSALSIVDEWINSMATCQ